MGVRQQQYAKELERQLGRKKILQKAHKRAARRAEIRDAKPKRKSKIAELIGGKKTYLYRQKEIEAKVAKRKPGRAKNILAGEKQTKRRKEVKATRFSRHGEDC